MAAEIELKKINEYVQECLAITSITGAYVYGIDSNGNSIKIAVEVLASAGTDYSAEIAELTRKCNNNTTLITALQSAVNGKANAVHTHQQSDITGLTTALEGKAATVHTHVISDVAGLQTSLNGKADANHTHGMSAIVGLTDALNSKANSVHTHGIGDVVNLQPTLANHEQRITNLEGQGGGNVSNALKQVDLSTYSGGSNGEIVQHIGETTADYTNGYTYKCAAGDAEKTIPAGAQCIRLTQGGEEYISDGEADTSTDKMVMVLQPTAEGVTYNVFAAQTIAETDIEKLVGCYVPDEIGAIHQITAITHNGTTLTSVTLDNGVSLEISSSTPTKSTLAWYEYFSKSGERFYGGSGTVGYMIASKDFVSAPSGDQSYPIATEKIGTAFGGTIQTFTASEDIVIRSVTWTQSNDQPPTSVASGDAFLTITNNELGVSIDISYNSSNQHLELKGKNSAVVSYVDMGVFIKDGMLDDAQLYTTAEQGVTVEVPYLKFTFNVASGKSVIRVSLKDLVDIYDGANINLTSAFVKAAQYSAPAIGDSMDVAIGKLLKGHEDNAAAIETKQDTLTFDSTPTAASNNPVTSGGIKAAIDNVATSGLKLVDLEVYEGTPNEIVKHNGRDTALYKNGYDYKKVGGSAVYPSDTLTYSLGNITPALQADAELFANITDKNFFKTSDTVTIYADNNISAGLYLGDKVNAEVGDTLYVQPNKVYNVTRVDNATYPYEVGYAYSNLTVTRSFQTPIWRNVDGIELISYTNHSDRYKQYPQTETDFPIMLLNGNKLHLGIADEAWIGSSDDVTPPQSWQQWNSQPSSEGAVSDLEMRMSAAETAISGKQPTITGAASTITDSNLTASKVLGSDANGKVAATSIATTDAADAVSKRHTQNTDTKLVDNNGNEILGINHLGNLEFKRSLRSSGSANGILLNDGSLSLVNGSASIGGNLSVSGNLNVTGKETVEEIVNIKSENNFITLRDGAQTAIASGSLSGTKVENYDGLGNDLVFGTDADGVFRIGDDGGTLEPIATRDEAANLTDGQLMKWDAANQRLVGINDIRVNTINGAPLSNAASYFYGVSTSAAADTMKTVSIPSITTLNAGQMIVVMPTVTSNTIQNATLKLNDFTVYPIRNNGYLNINSSCWNNVYATIFVFDGSEWKVANQIIYPLSVTEGVNGTSAMNRYVRADFLQQIIHGQIDKFVGTRAMTEDAYWDLVAAGTVQADTLYITFDNDWEG